MWKQVSATKVKKLPVMTDVKIVNDKTHDFGIMWIIKCGRKKILKGIYTTQEIKDRDGWHYEVNDRKGNKE